MGLLAIYRIGFQIPLPLVDQSITANPDAGGLGKFVEHVAVFSASDLSQATIFGLGIMPYISASIIFQLLGSVWKPMEDLQKEGEAGRKKINEYTRYATVVLCLFQSWAYVKFYVAAKAHPDFLNDAGNLGFGWVWAAAVSYTHLTLPTICSV